MVNWKCVDCGAMFWMDKELDKNTCPYCGSSNLVNG